ncbi:SF0329 family protein [Paenibacillus senegalimassiliensis]|uniref:SF0329 family protein n=1 Tax=Paenibacillus senegalimassiliensis TaxID=1737426 RepID=UPI00073FA780|nr:hypothetical protein [Paenibacillus senegalimassiliensis]
MSWSKLKQNLDQFLSPSLAERVEYRSTSYRYLPDRAGLCHITVDKRNIFNMKETTSPIKWYQTELEIKNDPDIRVVVNEEELDALRKETQGKVPEERLVIMAENRRKTECAKELLAAQTALSKSNFTVVANQFLARPIEESLESRDILLNVLALVDRRVGKKRLLNMAVRIKAKHPAVQYFYELRLSTF